MDCKIRKPLSSEGYITVEFEDGKVFKFSGKAHHLKAFVEDVSAEMNLSERQEENLRLGLMMSILAFKERENIITWA